MDARGLQALLGARPGRSCALPRLLQRSGHARAGCRPRLQHQRAPSERCRTRPPCVRVSAAAEAPTRQAGADGQAAGPPARTERKYVMISGKGGVGKTSLAASLACSMAAEGHTTLVVSTDPAHSLGDALAQDVGGGKPVPIEGTDLPLWALEIDADGARKAVQGSLSEGKGQGATSQFLKGMGLGLLADQLADLNLGELLESAPPGLDEAVAFAKVIEFVKGEEYARFTRIVFDTAPTGHTLRLLTTPAFLDSFLGKLISLRRKLGSAGAAVRGLFGAGEQQDAAIQKLEQLQANVRMVSALFRDRQANEFVIATIPTVLAMKESGRLLTALRSEGIPCRRMVVNQVIGPGMGEAYLKLKFRDQRRAFELIAQDPALSQLQLIRSPLVDLEVRGIPALRYFGGQVWGSSIEGYAAASERQHYLLGGKGGVGKTSTAAALGVQLAAAGRKTLVVSTDPAHSLSDSLDQDVSGGGPVAVADTDGLLYGMEIDPEATKAELRALAGRNKGGVGKAAGGFLGGMGLGAIASQLDDLALGELLDTLPPGVDEALAVSKVVQLSSSPDFADFSHIVFDTAPTGHTLRLLTLPEFIDGTIGKVVKLRQRLVDAADAVKGIFGVKKEQDSAVANLEKLRAGMEQAQALFRDADRTQFVIVSIPTVLAVAESGRLAQALRAEGVPVRTMVVNQVVDEAAAGKFLDRRRADQQRAMQLARESEPLRELEVIEAPLLDLEVRGVPALQYFGDRVWKQQQQQQQQQQQ